MWYPGRAQWVVIWITTLIVLYLWIDEGSELLWNTWIRIGIALAVVGALLVWMLAKPRTQN